MRLPWRRGATATRGDVRRWLTRRIWHWMLPRLGVEYAIAWPDRRGLRWARAEPSRSSWSPRPPGTDYVYVRFVVDGTDCYARIRPEGVED